MQKYTILFLIILIIGITFWEINKTIRDVNLDNILSSEIKAKPTPTPVIVPNGKVTEVESEGIRYLVLSVKIPKTAIISLIPNFKERIFGEKLVNDYNCYMGINGGFYLGSEQPLGLFIIRGKYYNKESRSNIANAFVWQDLAGNLKFEKMVPDYLAFTDFIFQAGPYITPANKRLNLISDEKARRSLLAKDIQGNLYFISVASKDNLVGGPHLAQIPVIFWQLKQRNILPLEELVNMDGGSASFFFSKDNTDNFILTSWAPVGSLLCASFAN